MKVICIDGNPENFLGVIGEPTDFKDFYGNQIHVGDELKLLNQYVIDDGYCCHEICSIKNYSGSDYKFIMGIAGVKPNELLHIDEINIDLNKLYVDAYDEPINKKELLNLNNKAEFTSTEYGRTIFQDRWLVLIKRKYSEFKPNESYNGYNLKVSREILEEDNDLKFFIKKLKQYNNFTIF